MSKTVKGTEGNRGNDLKVKIFELACCEDISTQDRRRMLESIIQILTRHHKES